MDTSKEYIKMCEKAEEIQSNWKTEIGTYFNSCMGGICIYTGRLGTSGWTYEMICENNIEGREVWLPRQDQLQEMLLAHFNFPGYGIYQLFIRLGRFMYVNHEFTQDVPEIWKKYDSMEQIWLAFLMFQKYGKFWNGKNWKLVTIRRE